MHAQAARELPASRLGLVGSPSPRHAHGVAMPLAIVSALGMGSEAKAANQALLG